MNFLDSAWRLSPSDLTFLYEECPRCFWGKVAGNLPRPRGPFPKIFTLLDSQTKEFFLGKRTEDISTDVKPGRVLCGDRWVRSGPLPVPGHAIPVLLQGRFDTAFAFDDGTFGLVDFKTTDPKSGHVPLYGRQLHAYALAAENPAPGALELRPVTQLGLLCVEPTMMVAVGRQRGLRGHAALAGDPEGRRGVPGLLVRSAGCLGGLLAPAARSGLCVLRIPHERSARPLGRRALHLGGGGLTR